MEGGWRPDCLAVEKGPGPKRLRRSLMIYLIEARHTDERMDLHVLDWWNLLGLAAQYGWRPAEGVDHYLYEASFVPGAVSRDIAEVLKKALPHLPEEQGPRVRSANPPMTTITSPVPKGPYEDPRDHFGGSVSGSSRSSSSCTRRESWTSIKRRSRTIESSLRPS
jgi:hypothetical protein